MYQSPGFNWTMRGSTCGKQCSDQTRHSITHNTIQDTERAGLPRLSKVARIPNTTGNWLVELPNELTYIIATYVGPNGLRGWRETCYVFAYCGVLGLQMQWLFDRNIDFKKASRWPVRHLKWASTITNQEIQRFICYDWPMLQNLNMHGCRRLTDASLLSLGTQPLRSVQCLNLRGCSGLTDDACQALSPHNWPVLHQLILQECRKLTDIGWLMIAAHTWPTLVYLNLSHCFQLTDAG
jgi:hypothetical protein